MIIDDDGAEFEGYTVQGFSCTFATEEFWITVGHARSRPHM
jgi:hypothetical protein